MDEKDGSTPINKATYAEEQEIKRVTDDYGKGKSPIQEYEDQYYTDEYQKKLIEQNAQRLQGQEEKKEPVENPAQEPVQGEAQPVQEETQPVQEQAQPVVEPEEKKEETETEEETSDDVEETVTEETDQNKEVKDGSAEEPEQEAEEAPQEPDPEDQMRRAKEEARRRYSEELRNMRMQDAVALGIDAVGTGIASIGDSIGAVEHLFDAIMSGNPVSVASTMLADTLANNTRRENHINALFADYRVLRGADEAVLATTVRGNMLLSRKREVMRGDALATIEVGDWLKNRKGPDGRPLDVANMSAQDIADFNAFCRQRVTAITNMIHDPKAKLSPQDRRAWEATLRRYGWILSDVGARAGELRSQAEAGVESATQEYNDAKEAASLAGDALHAAQAQHKASATGVATPKTVTGKKGKGPRTVNTSTTTVVPPTQAGGTGPAPAPATTTTGPVPAPQNTAVDPNQAVGDPNQVVDPNQANVTPPEDTSTDTEEAVDPQAQQVVDPDPQAQAQEVTQPVPPPAYTDVVWSMESKWGANRGDYGVAYADQARTNRKNFASRIKTLEGNLARTAPGTPENIYLTNEIALRRGFNNMLILGNKFKGSPIYKVLSDVERKRVLDNLERSFSDFSKTMFDGNGYLRADAIMPDWIDPLNDIQYLSGKEAPNMFIEINNLRNNPIASDPNQSANMDELSTLSNDILDNPSKYSTPESQAEFRTKLDAIKGRFTVTSPTTPETEAEAETETKEAPIDDYIKGLLTSDPDNFLDRVLQDAKTGNDAAARTLGYLNDAGIADFDESTQTWQFLNGAGVDDLRQTFGVSAPVQQDDEEKEQDSDSDRERQANPYRALLEDNPMEKLYDLFNLHRHGDKDATYILNLLSEKGLVTRDDDKGMWKVQDGFEQKLAKLSAEPGNEPIGETDITVDEYLRRRAASLSDSTILRIQIEADSGNPVAEEALKLLESKGVIYVWGSGRISPELRWEEKFRALYPDEEEVNEEATPREDIYRDEDYRITGVADEVRDIFRSPDLNIAGVFSPARIETIQDLMKAKHRITPNIRPPEKIDEQIRKELGRELDEATVGEVVKRLDDLYSKGGPRDPKEDDTEFEIPDDAWIDDVEPEEIDSLRSSGKLTNSVADPDATSDNILTLSGYLKPEAWRKFAEKYIEGRPEDKGQLASKLARESSMDGDLRSALKYLAIAYERGAKDAATIADFMGKSFNIDVKDILGYLKNIGVLGGIKANPNLHSKEFLDKIHTGSIFDEVEAPDSIKAVLNTAKEPATEETPGSEVNFSSFTTPEQFEDYLKENGDKGKDAINDWLFSIPEDQRPSFIESVLNTDYGNGAEESDEEQSAIKEALDQYYEENSNDDYEPFDVYKMFPNHTDVLNNIFNAYSENQLEGLLFPPGGDVELGELEDTLKDYHILAERDYVENGEERKRLYIHPEWRKGRQLLRAGERPDIHIPDVEEFKERTRSVSPIGVSRYVQDLLRSKDYLDPEQTEKLEFLFSALEDRGIVPKGTFDDPDLFKNVDRGAYNGLFTDGEKPREFSDQFVYDEDSTYDELNSAAKQLSEASKMGKGEVEAAEDLIDPALNALISTRTQTPKGKPISGMYGAFQLARALSVLHNSNNMEPEFRIEGGHYKELSEYDRNSVEKLLRAMRTRVERAKEAVKAENDGQFPPDALAQIRDRVKQEIVGKDPKKYHELFINPDREADLTDAKTVRDIGLTGPFNLGGKTMGISALRNIIDADKPDKPYEGDRDALDRARIHAANALLEGVGRSVITDPYFTGLRLLDGLEGGRWENHPVVTDLRKKLNDTMDSQEPQSLRDIKENFIGHDTDLINMISRVDRKSGNNPRFELKIMPDGDPYIWDNALGTTVLDRNRKFYRDPTILGTMLDHIMDENFGGAQQLKAYYMNNPELFRNLNAALDALYDDDEVRSMLGDMSDVDENEMLGYMFVAEADSPSPSVQLILDEAIHNYLDGGMPWDALKGYSAEDLVELAKNGMMAIDEARKQVGESMRKSVSLFARAMIEEPDHEVTRFVLGMMGASPMENIEMFMKSVKPSEIGDPVFARITGTYRGLLGL